MITPRRTDLLGIIEALASSSGAPSGAFAGEISGAYDPAAVHAGDEAGDLADGKHIGGTYPEDLTILAESLVALEALAPAADKFPYYTDEDSAALADITAAARAFLAAATDDQVDALAGTTGTPSDTNRYVTEQGPRANLSMNLARLTNLLDAFGLGDAVNLQQLLVGIDAAVSGMVLKRPVYAASIAALPAHSRSGNTLTASANGDLSTAFGTTAAATFTAGAYLARFGSQGSGNGQFQGAAGIAQDGSGNLYVADWLGGRIQKFNSAGVYQAHYSLALCNPYDLARDSSGRFYVLDSIGGRLVRYSSAGVHQESLYFSGDHWLRGGPTPYYPKCIAIAPDDSAIIVSDSQGTTGWVAFDPLDLNAGITGSGGNDVYGEPNALAYDSSGKVYAAVDSQVARYANTDDDTADLTIGSAGLGNGQFQRASGIGIDGSGNVFVSDSTLKRVQKFNSSGTYQSQFGSSGSGNGQFTKPSVIAIASGDPWVVDGSLNRAQKFSGTVTTLAPDLLVRHEGSGTHLENGLYVLDDPGSGSTKWSMTRRDDGDESGEVVFGTLVHALHEDAASGGWFYQAVSSVIDINTTAMVWDRRSGQGVEWGLVTALPSSPGHNDRCTFVDSLTAPTYRWHLVYNASSGSAYKWEFVGGNSLYDGSNIARALNNQTAFTSLPTDPLSITCPLAGDYEVTVEADIVTPATSQAGGFISYSVGSTAASDTFGARAQTAAAVAVYLPCQRKSKQLGIISKATPGTTDVIVEKARTLGNYQCSWDRRRLWAMPIRVG